MPFVLPQRRAIHASAWVLVTAVAAGFAVACGSDDADGTATRTQTLVDVREACASRATWTAPEAPVCRDCLAIATVPACSCDLRPERGRCLDASNLWGLEKDCEGDVASCVAACASDCGCVERCYDGHDACRRAAGLRDGCLVETCAASCGSSRAPSAP